MIFWQRLLAAQQQNEIIRFPVLGQFLGKNVLKFFNNLFGHSSLLSESLHLDLRVEIIPLVKNMHKALIAFWLISACPQFHKTHRFFYFVQNFPPVSSLISKLWKIFCHFDLNTFIQSTNIFYKNWSKGVVN